MSQNHFFIGAAPIVDLDVLNSIKELSFSDWFQDFQPSNINIDFHQEYLDYFTYWFIQSKLNSIKGIDRFPFKKLTSGITQSFDDFIIRHRNRTFKLLPGEYSYVKRAIDDCRKLEEIESNDAIIISAPFSATGNLHPAIKTILQIASNRNVPVMIDCAFFGICQNLIIDLEYDCIEKVCFSSSKIFASGNFRAGIEYSKYNSGILSVQNDWNYVQTLSAKINLELMKQYHPDYIFNKYRSKQKLICDKNNLEYSDTVIFGLSDKGNPKYNFDNVVYRYGISNLIREYSTNYE